ncbi:MAG: GNAT family N-acetyltransferase [Clostridiales bacterium]|nr:GNAT family N-acetyltransferase [Clostridiales bacterium]
MVNKMPEPDFGFIISGETTAIYSPKSLEWRNLILECHPQNASEVMRYWIVQKDYDFDRENLRDFVNGIPEEYCS